MDFFTTSPPGKPRWKDHDAMILVFWMLSFKPTFSLSSFTFIKKLFSSLVRGFPICKTSHEKPIWYCYLYSRHFWRDAKAHNMGEGRSLEGHIGSCLGTITETGCKSSISIVVCLFFFISFIFDCGSSLLCGLFSSCIKWDLISSCGKWASHCGGFSFCSSQALKQRLKSWGSWV